MNWDLALPFLLGLIAFWIGAYLQGVAFTRVLRPFFKKEGKLADWEELEERLLLGADRVQGLIATITVAGVLVVATPEGSTVLLRVLLLSSIVLAAVFACAPNRMIHPLWWARARARRLSALEVSYMAVGATTLFAGGFLIALLLIPVPTAE